jgi:hypothetical protein
MTVIKFPAVDQSSAFYKNCKRQRAAEAKICGDCPFRAGIEMSEKGETPAPEPEPKMPSAVNSREVIHLIQLWKDNGMPELSMGDKVEISVLLSKYPNLEEILHRWFAYNLHFKGVLPGKRHEMYLYQNKLSSLSLHINQFIDDFTYGTLFNEHVLRVQNFNEKNRQYGFSSDPAEDRKMAMEKERMDISFSIQAGRPYIKGIEFSENLAYYKKKWAAVKNVK